MTAQNYFRMVSLALFMAIASSASSAMIVPVTDPAKTAAARSEQLVQRLEEIKGMNRSEMSRLEKKGLRKEVRAIKKEMKVMSGGVYLSIGAIIIVILLLILLL